MSIYKEGFGVANNVKTAFKAAGINGMQSIHIYGFHRTPVAYQIYYYPLFDNYLDLNNFIYL